MQSLWRLGLGDGREPSRDQEDAITAPSYGRRSVDAGAGTGKTSTLALRALYLIESGEMRADQIVVVTFTKKAAAEIGGRITDTIDRALANGAHFDGGGRGTRCTTIHALAADILREFALTFGFTNAPRAITDGEAYGLFHEAFLALLEGDLTPDTSALPIAEVNRGQFERDLGKLALRLKNHGITPDMFSMRAIAEAERFGKQTWGQLWSAGAKAGTRKGLEPKIAFGLDDIVLEAEREQENIIAVTALFKEFDRRIQEKDRLTYGDLISVATMKLREHPQIIAELRSRWRYLLLDECQDTSAMQLAFIETVFGTPEDPDACGMMPVGDKRQAIYSFNGADEGVMARISATAHSKHPLTVNRRSPQEIVDAGHTVLETLSIVDGETPRLVASAGAQTMSCIRLQCFGNEGMSVKECVAVEAAGIAQEIQRLLSDPNEQTKTSDIAILLRRRTHAYSYVRALNERGIPAALDRRSGLFAVDEIRDLLAWMSLLLDINDRQSAVRILQSPQCGLSDATMITIAETPHWLDRLLNGDLPLELDAEALERIEQVRTSLIHLLPCVSLPLKNALGRLIEELPTAAAYARLGTAIGAQAIVNLRSFKMLADDFTGGNPAARLSDFLEDVQRRILYDDEPQEAELDQEGVRVMTIHQAKGLEWPYVFVACSTKNQYGTAGPTETVVAYDLQSGAFAIKNNIEGRETFRWACIKNEHDFESGEKVELPLWKTLAEREQARVFYVALTRAQRCVYITAPCPEKGSKSAAYLGSIRAWAQKKGDDLDLRFCAPTESDEASKPIALFAAATIGEAASVAESVQLSLFQPRVSFSSIATYQTCPRMARYRYRLLLPDLRERATFAGLETTNTVVTNATRLGSVTHRILELWGAAAIVGRSASLDEITAQAAGEFLDATAHEIESSRLRATRAIDVLSGFTIIAVEEPFTIEIAGTILEGAIDLIARAADGVLHVIDYKTGKTGDEHYALQLALYQRAAAQRYVGETTLGAILRISDSGATMTIAPQMAGSEVDSSVLAAGTFENDTPIVGIWCGSCPYNEAPCLAPR